MSAKLTPEERDEILTFVREVVAATVKAAAPHIIEMIASTKPGIKYTRVGDQCVIEPHDPFAGMAPLTGTITPLEEFQPIGGRDYRKQLWLDVFSMTYVKDIAEAEQAAKDALARFDEAFPK